MSLRERASTLLDASFLQKRCQFGTVEEIVVQETEPTGAARVTVLLSGPTECVQFRLEKGQKKEQNLDEVAWFRFLKNEKCADGSFLVSVGPETYELYVIECKTKLGSDNWERAKAQMAGSIARVQAIAAVLGIRITRIHCATAYREDILTTALPADFGEQRPLVGKSVRTAGLLDWQRSVADLGPLGELPHRQIRLTVDAQGVGLAVVAWSAAGVVPVIQ